MIKRNTYSFQQWTIDNNRNDILELWDFDKNDKSPKDIGYKSNLKYWFKCPCGRHKSEQKDIQYISNGRVKNIHCIKCDSFAQHIIDKNDEAFLYYLWSDKNCISPWVYNAKSNKKVWLRCENNPKHIYLTTSCHYFIDESRCPFCSGMKVFVDESLGALYKNAFSYWSDKNKKSPYDYTCQSGQKIWLKCNRGKHKDYQRRVADAVSNNFVCPTCTSTDSKQHADNLTGVRFGALTVLMRDYTKDLTSWYCKCDCGSPILHNVTAHSLKLGDTTNCGCKINLKGENAPNWKGGITPERQAARGSREYKQWRNNVYAKDWYTCQCCGKSKQIIKNAHHIQSFAKFTELRYDVNNGITMCKQCHYSTEQGSFHQRYGTTNNTEEQLEYYINIKRQELGIPVQFNLEEYKNGNIVKPKDFQQYYI